MTPPPDGLGPLRVLIVALLLLAAGLWVVVLRRIWGRLDVGDLLVRFGFMVLLVGGAGSVLGFHLGVHPALRLIAPLVAGLMLTAGFATQLWKTRRRK